MSKEMQTDAIRFAKIAFDKHISTGELSHIARYVKDEFDDKYKETW